MNFSYFLLQIIPGLNNTIPGVERTYLPEQGAAAAAALFDKTYADAWLIFGLMVFISITFSVISKYVDLGEEWNIIQALKRIGTIAVLLVGFKFLFGTVFIANHALSIHIFGEDNVSKLNQQFEKIATNEQENKGVTGDSDENVISRLFTMLGQITSDIIVDTLAAIIAFVFFISTTLMHMLWRIAVIILYVTGPILIALSLFPGFGAKILAGWFGATFQVAFWQVWFAICAFFVQTSDNTDLLKFTVGNTKAATANHIESVVFALIFTILYIGTPLVVNLLVPISSFSSGLVGALKAGGFPVKAAIGTVAGAAGSVAGIGAKGLLGAASKLFSREGGAGSASAGVSGAKPAIDRGSGPKTPPDIGNAAKNGGSDPDGSGGGGRTASNSEGLQDRRARKFNVAKVGRERENRANGATSPNGNNGATIGANRRGTNAGGTLDRGTSLGANGLSSPIITQIGSSIGRSSNDGSTGVSASTNSGIRGTSSVSNASSVGNRSSNPASTDASSGTSSGVNRNSNIDSTPSSSNSSSSSVSGQTPSAIDRASSDNSTGVGAVSSSSTVIAGNRSTANGSSGVDRNSNVGSTPSSNSSSSNSSSPVASQNASSINRGSVAGVGSNSTNISGSRTTPNTSGASDRNSLGSNGSASNGSSSNSSSPIITQIGSSINRGGSLDRNTTDNNSNSNSTGNRNVNAISANKNTGNGSSGVDRSSNLGSSASSNTSSPSSSPSNQNNGNQNNVSSSTNGINTNTGSNRNIPNQDGAVNRNGGLSSSSSSSNSSSTPSKAASSPIITQIGSSISRGSNGSNGSNGTNGSNGSSSSSSNVSSAKPLSNRGNMRFMRLRAREDKPTDKA